MCKAIYWGFMSVVSWLLAPVKMRYPSNPFWCLTLSNFKYAQCPEFSIFSTGCACFICFITFNHPEASISRISNWKKRRKEDIYNKHREMDSPQFCRYCKVNTALRSIGLILKIKLRECVYETLHSNLAQSWEIIFKKKLDIFL